MKITMLSAATLRSRLKRGTRLKRIQRPSSLENEFDSRWKRMFPELPLDREVQFDNERRYRFDFCHRGAKVGVEIQGGIWQRGGHSTGKGITRDCKKNHLAITGGWVVFALTDEMIRDEATLRGIADTILRRGR